MEWWGGIEAPAHVIGRGRGRTLPEAHDVGVRRAFRKTPEV